VAKPVTGFVVFGPQAGPINTGDFDGNYNLLAGAVNDMLSYSNFLVDSSPSANLITVTAAAGLAYAYTAGLTLLVQIANTNTSGAVSLNLNALGNKAIVNADTTLPGIGALQAGMVIPMTYDGTQFRLTGPQSNNIVGGVALFSNGSPTSPSVSFLNSPGMGLYMSGVNTLGFSTAGINRMSIGPTGTVTVAAPTSGVSFQAVAAAGASQYAGYFNAPNTAGQSFGVRIAAGTNTSDYGLNITNASNANQLFSVRGDGQCFAWEQLAGINALKTVPTNDTGSFTMTGVGFSSAPTATIKWARVGDLIFLSCPAGMSGTSNATTFTGTGLPSLLFPASTQTIGSQVYTDNGTNAQGKVQIASTGGFTFYKDPAFTGWSSTGTKGFAGGWTCIYQLD